MLAAVAFVAIIGGVIMVSMIASATETKSHQYGWPHDDAGWWDGDDGGWAGDFGGDGDGGCD